MWSNADITFLNGLVAFFVLVIYSMFVAVSFYNDNPDAPELTWKNFLKRAIGFPICVAIFFGFIYCLGLIVELFTG